MEWPSHRDEERADLSAKVLPLAWQQIVNLLGRLQGDTAAQSTRRRHDRIDWRKGFAMQFHHGALLLACGMGIGAVTSGVLHAQITPPAFTIAEIQVTDPDTFKQYAIATGTAIPAAGGRFTVRSGKSFVINGEPPKSIAVIQWDSLDKARSFFESPDYKKLVPVRDKGSKFRAFTIEGAAK